ncbi:hypothetical protein HZH66_001526 [Vespula vulgaris]|uniref:Uncharacterized protein n=1 Tax=Vespula vulgaris TaxID=7454 RepID=A0A834KUQ2_VESVU|nr:hypothetical protein HZH66_001526 [Vespula vulgaris]
MEDGRRRTKEEEYGGWKIEDQDEEEQLSNEEKEEEEEEAEEEEEEEVKTVEDFDSLICIRDTIHAQPAASSRRNTKFPYSDALRQKLTLLRFIDPQYCVPAS